MKTIRIVFLLTICVLIALSLVFFNAEKDYASPVDNRMLTEWDTSGSLDEDIWMLDSYLNDRIGFRTASITNYTVLNDRVFGMMIHPTYTYGREGYVFLKPGYETVNEEFIELFCEQLRKAQDYCEERGVPFIYCLDPSKTTVYSQYLPEGYEYKNLFNEVIRAKLEEYGVNYITNEDVLIERSETQQVFNVKYDAGHWNDIGCFYGTNNLLNKVSEYFDAVKENDMNDFRLSSRNVRSLPVSFFEINEDIPMLISKEAGRIIDVTGDYEAIRLDQRHQNHKMMINESDEASLLPRALVFLGSYYNGRSRFLRGAFREYDSIHNYENFIDLDYYFNIFQPDCVILESAEYTISPDYFSKTGLSEKHLNEKLDIASAELMDIENYDYSVDTHKALVTVTIESEDPYYEGYLVIGEKQFDFLYDNDEGCYYCTIHKDHYSEDMKIFFR